MLNVRRNYLLLTPGCQSVNSVTTSVGRSVLAKSWAGPDSHTEGSKYRPSSATKAGRDYPRPWMSGSKSSGKSVGDKDNMRPHARAG